MGDVWGSRVAEVESEERATKEEEQRSIYVDVPPVSVVPPSLAQLSARASQRYADLYTASTIRAFPEPIQEVLLHVLDKSDQVLPHLYPHTLFIFIFI
jgi:hypothetical protein